MNKFMYKKNIWYMKACMYCTSLCMFIWCILLNACFISYTTHTYIHRKIHIYIYTFSIIHMCSTYMFAYAIVWAVKSYFNLLWLQVFATTATATATIATLLRQLLLQLKLLLLKRILLLLLLLLSLMLMLMLMLHQLFYW